MQTNMNYWISGKRLFIILAALVLLISVTGCSSAEKGSAVQTSTPAVNVGEKPVYSPDASCSIFIYMCGSNLESSQGLAGKDIDELLKADIPENVNVIIETGGAKEWHSHGIANDKIQRYIVADHKLTLLEEAENQDMGSSETFRDWLKWGADHYLGERNVLIIWDHGGDATQGVCYDENYGYHGLKQSELSTSFEEWGITKADIQKKYPKIDMLIFDTCFMGNIETVSWLGDYFHYMIASQVIMPGGGLDYKVITEEFAGHDDESYGRIVCDSFREECEKNGQAEKTELSLYDLSQADAAVASLEDVFGDTQDSLPLSAKKSAVVENSIKFNVVDLKNLIDNECAGKAILDSAGRVLEKLVCYQVGEVNDYSLAETDPDYGKARCTGVSMYYPLKFDEDELNKYIKICPVKNYASLLESIYLKQQAELEFEDSGSINSKGAFEITLTRSSKPYINYLVGKFWKEGESGEPDYLIGKKTFFLTEEQKELTFSTEFNGKWYHLSGYPLTGEGYWDNGKDLFHAKILHNGEETIYNFLSRYDLVDDPVISVGYVGTQFDENKLVNRQYRLLKKGDVVTILSNNPKAEKVEFKVNSLRLKPEFKMLKAGAYRFQFTAVALDNSSIDSDYVIFDVTEDGAKAVEIMEYE